MYPQLHIFPQFALNFSSPGYENLHNFTFFTIVCILLRISLLLNYIYHLCTLFDVYYSVLSHYMFRPQRVIIRCSTYITLLLHCTTTHFLLSPATTSMCIYSQHPIPFAPSAKYYSDGNIYTY
jgi:hypothetical protein